MRRPSSKQIRTLQLISQGYSKRRAMIEAGYSISSANQARRVLSSESMKGLMDNFQDKLVDAGLTTDYLTNKIKTWFEATKIVNGQEVPDNDIQIKAFQIWSEIMKLGEAEEDSKIKTKITLEEFIMGKTPEDIEESS